MPSEQDDIGWGKGGSSAVGLEQIGGLDDTIAAMVTAWEATSLAEVSSTSLKSDARL